MHSVEKKLTPLTQEQKRLVEANIGLVGVNLRRFGRRWDVPRSTRERDDLFQEGCLALIGAVRKYPQGCDIPFAAYALPRIRNAMAAALQRGFTSVRVPLKRRPLHQRKGQRSEMNRHRPHQLPAGEFDFTTRADDRRHHPFAGEDYERLGDRMRERYERAVRRSVDDMQGARDKRGDLPELVRRLAEERLLLPAEEARVSLRELALGTKSSYARVHGCEQRLLELIRQHLEKDLVFRALRSESARHDDGPDTPFDDEMRQRVRSGLEDVCVSLFTQAGAPRRAPLFRRLLELANVQEATLVRQLLKRLSPSAFEKLIDEWSVRSAEASATAAELSWVRQSA